MTLSGLLAIIYLANVLAPIINRSHFQTDLFSANMTMFSTLLLSMVIQITEWKKRLITSGVNFIFYFLAFFTMCIYFIYFFNLKGSSNERIVFEILNLILKLSLVVAFSFANRSDSQDLTAEEKASFLSRITFFWMTRIMIKGCQRKLSEKDVPSLSTSEEAEHLHQKFKIVQQKLSHQNVRLAETSSASDSVSLIKVLINMYWKEIMIIFSLRLCYDILIFLNPVLLKIFMTYLRSDSGDKDKKSGFVYSFLYFIINVVLVLLDQVIFARGWKTGTNVSSTLMTIIYDKLQKIGFQTSENVVIINLLSTDVTIFREMIPYLYILWSGPFQTVICFIILFCYIKLGALFCFLIIPLIFLFFIISKKIAKMQNEYSNMRSNRIQLLEEMIEYIKSIKLFAQEDAYIKKLNKIRDQEINHLKMRVYYETFISTLGEISPQWITLLIFITLSLINNINSITTEHIFITLMALNILETNMSMYSDCIFDIIKAKESYKNIVMFLKLEDRSFKPDDEMRDKKLLCMCASLDLLGKVEKENSGESVHSVVITNATFKDQCLKHINLKIKVGQLVAICGDHTSGKSALLYALLGQIRKESGRVCRVGKVAFTPQEPWVINDTIKMNILFGKIFHKRHFQQILKYCCLEDIKEETIVNGKGSNLSGGQLYRINLARAVYSRPNIFLLDNPLCAIDVATARNIYENLLGKNGLLKNITRIIVTQPTAHWLPNADQIIVMDSKTIAESGTFTELMYKKGKFVQLLQQCPQNKGVVQSETEKKKSLLIFRSVELQYRPIFQTTSQVGSKFWKISSTKWKTKSGLSNISDPPSERFIRQLSRMLYMNKKSLKISQLKFEDLSSKNSNFKVAQRVFRKYLKSIGIFSLLSTILVGVLFEGFKTTSNYLFEIWSDQIHSNSTEDKNINLIYSGSFSLIAGLFLLLFGMLSTLFTAKASCKIHHSMAENVFNMPLEYFANADQGIIMLTFTDNLYDVDYELPNFYKMWIKDFLRIMTASVLLIWKIPIFAIFIIILIIIVFIMSVIFVLATSVLQDFNFKFQSLLYTHFLETESGTHIIKAFNNEEIFIKKAYKYIDNYQKFYWSVSAAKRWSGFLLQFIGCFIILIACICIVQVNDVSRVGLLLTYLTQTVKCFDWVVRTASDIAIKRVSLHKIQEYRDKIPVITGKIMPNWPTEGEIEFLNYSAAYSNVNMNCLNDINLCIHPREKVGIVGKSGSGKSSLLMAITRLVNCMQGQINIDGIDIKLLNPKYLRSKLTIFPQNTYLFTGNLRSNLDPEDKFTDEELTSVLSDVHLKGRNLDQTCEMFSVGDKQLVGLAKCILNKTKVLILDEYTANVCATLDEQIQQIIEEKFSDCTVLSIVHKLSMTEKYDKILVMDQGEVKEFDTPNNLLNRKHGFYMKLKEQESKTSL